MRAGRLRGFFKLPRTDLVSNGNQGFEVKWLPLIVSEIIFHPVSPPPMSLTHPHPYHSPWNTPLQLAAPRPCLLSPFSGIDPAVYNVGLSDQKSRARTVSTIINWLPRKLEGNLSGRRSLLIFLCCSLALFIGLCLNDECGDLRGLVCFGLHGRS